MGIAGETYSALASYQKFNQVRMPAVKLDLVCGNSFE